MRPRQALDDGTHRRLGAAGGQAALARQPDDADTRLLAPCQARRRGRGRNATCPEVCTKTLPAAVAPAARQGRAGSAQGHPLGRHLLRALPPRGGERPRSRCWVMPASMPCCPRRRCAAAVRCTTSATWIWPSRSCARMLDIVAGQISEGDGAPIAVVGLEPGCMSVFKDELLKLFPDDPTGQAPGGQHLAARGLPACPRLPPAALRRGGARACPLPPEVAVRHEGRCGAARTHGCASHASSTAVAAAWPGSFGFNPEHIEISKAVGELVLLPAVRQQSAETVILTNGFSCREQIQQGTGREVMHLAELLQLAHRRAATGSRRATPR